MLALSAQYVLALSAQLQKIIHDRSISRAHLASVDFGQVLMALTSVASDVSFCFRVTAFLPVVARLLAVTTHCDNSTAL
jgi:hypothetical protein